MCQSQKHFIEIFRLYLQDFNSKLALIDIISGWLTFKNGKAIAKDFAEADSLSKLKTKFLSNSLLSTDRGYSSF